MSDASKDIERKARIDVAFNAAMAGDRTAMQCLLDMSQGISSGPTDPRACAVGSQVAADYAVRRWSEFAQATADANGLEVIPGAQLLPPLITTAGPTPYVPHTVTTEFQAPPLASAPGSAPYAAPGAPGGLPWGLIALVAIGGYFVLTGKAGSRRTSW